MTRPRGPLRVVAAALILVALVSCTPRGRRGSGPEATGTAALAIVRIIDRLAVQGFTLRTAESGLRDLASTADLAGNAAAERAALEKNRFVRSYARLFTRGQYSVAALAYEFRTAGGAAGYMTYTLDDARRNEDARFFTVGAIPGARGQTQRNEREDFYLRAVSFPRGTVLYSVVIGGPRIPDAGDVVRLAQTLDRLIAGAK